MFKKILFSSSLFAFAAAQSGAYGQCGGIGWTGATTCVSGYTCTYSNPYYSQCLPGTASTTKSTTTMPPPPTSTPAPTKTTSTTTSTAAGITPTSAAPLTGATQCTQAGAHYTLCQNLWGASAGVGSQTSTLLGTAANAVSWSTNWNWQNGQNSVKSYANIISNTAKGIQLGALKTAPTSWSWTYQSASSGIRADVSYDIWTGAASSGNPASSASNYEIMIWLSGEGGIQPVGQAIQTGISIGGYTWTLWSGPNQGWNVFSFVSANGNINNFNADLKGFFTFLVQNHGVSSSQYIQAIQTGTEPFTGSANLIINSYSVSIS